MGTQNICLYKEIDKKYTDCNLRTTELLDCVLIGVCGVIRLNMVCFLVLGFICSDTALIWDTNIPSSLVKNPVVYVLS